MSDGEGIPADIEAEYYDYLERGHRPSEIMQAASVAFENPSILRPIEKEELPW